MICNVFDDPDDKALCFTKLLSDVMEKNAPSKTKIIKKPSVPFWFDDEIPDDFQTTGGFAKIIDKHSSHPSIIKIKEHSSTERSFVFRDINGSEVEKMIKTMDPRKAEGFDNVPSKLLRLGALGIAHHISSLINHSLQLLFYDEETFQVS